MPIFDSINQFFILWQLKQLERR
ncbi:hypothetical protein EZS27_026896, partial [termite gut metagenome]